MSMNPSEIRDIKFSIKFRGYDTDKVDIFLENLFNDYEELYRYKQENEIYIKDLEECLLNFTDNIPKRRLTREKEAPSEYTSDTPKREETNDQEPEAINDSIFY